MDLNSYSNLREDLKIQTSRVNEFLNDTSKNLYWALLLNKDQNWDLWNLLKWSDTLSNTDKDRLAYTIDYLRISGKSDVIKKLEKEDFDKIRQWKTPWERTETLNNIIIQKAKLSIDDDNEKNNFEIDIKKHVDLALKAKNSIINSDLAEDMSLSYFTTKNYRHYGYKIKKVLEDNNNNMKDCYLDVIKYSLYAWKNILWRNARRITPMKFSRHNIPKQVTKAKEALDRKLSNSTDKKEILAISYITKQLQSAYDQYLRTLWPSNSAFNNTIQNAQDRIYNNAA